MIRSAAILITLLLTLVTGVTAAEENAPDAETSNSAEAVSQDTAADLVVVRVSGDPITEKQVLDAINELTKQENYTLEQSKQRNTLLFDRAVESLMTVSLMRTRMREMNITVDDADLEEQFKLLTQRFSSTEAFQNAMADQGLTETDLRNNLRENIRMQKVVDEASKNAAAITEADIEKCYVDNPNQFALPERAHMAHILLKVPPDATAAQKEEIRKRLEGIRIDIEADIITFTDAAAKYSQDENTATKGGDMGFMTRGNLPKPFADMLFNTKPGTVSPALESQSGYHIIQALELKPAEQASLQDAKSALRQLLEENAKQSARQKYIEDLKNKATIEYFMTLEEFDKRH